MERPSWAPDNIDLDRPSIARVYDYYLGGSHNFAVDRALGQRVVETFPLLPMILQENRAFLRRAVRYAVACGVTQFLDIGSGIPTVGNVHEVAQEADPGSTVVYVDIDPIAVAHSRAILEGNELCTAIQADIRQPAELLAHPELRAMIDFDQPVAVLMVALLHFFTDDDEVRTIISTVRQALAPGSLLAIAQASGDHLQENGRQAAEEYTRAGMPMRFRSKAEIEALYEGFELVEPGVALFSLWRPDSPDDVSENPEQLSGYAAVGRAP
ncbi:MAG: SAM-dependent methyltransferase [Micromonosporaceae bacterium]